MNQRAIIMTLVLFALIVIGMFTFAYLKKQEAAEVTEAPATAETPAAFDPYAGITRIDGKHYYIDGTHTVVGEIALPTPCDLLESEVFVAESFPEQVTIDFSVINNSESCIQQVTAARFMVEAGVAEAATWSARLQGRSVELNLIPAAPGETPDEFELFIKG